MSGATSRAVMEETVASRPSSASLALRVARGAQPAWAAGESRARAEAIGRVARLLAQEADSVAAAMALVTGRPPGEVWSGEILPTLDALGWLHRRGVRHLAPRALGRSWTQWYLRATRHELHWEPFGVVGVVTPGNSLLFLALPQIAAALLAGNAVLWKPAPAGGTLALHAVSLFYRAGVSPALLQVVPGEARAAREIVEAGVDKLFFTGGEEAGRTLYHLHASRGRPAALELSGRHVSLVLADADPRLAARGIVWGKLANGGRNCVSVQLVLVEAEAEQAFLDAARETMSEAPAAPAALVAGAERVRLRRLVDDAVGRGARLLLGDGEGPTLLAEVADGMRVVEEEVLGPILAVARVASRGAAAAWINSRPHRLSASVWTGDPASGRRLARQLDVGQVWINDQLHPTGQPEVPLSGRGASGFGAARGLPGLMEAVQPKVISETPLGSPRRHYLASPGGVDLFRATAALAFGPGAWGRVLAAGRLLRALGRQMRPTGDLHRSSPGAEQP